ncbi:epoxide hydrolase family protein [Williamsia phyllosphaerae]|uniref:Epoxide hydrolase n=1 Tax=Williamsia phyllosphaerae TaxID=885042 RepID=A0ABQ1UDZ0_9NOCA|nr:epoxide hydrolase family protein [Williamsia phyllosphaerae]GGF14015.1 epoxide hydrolase [Williamsia phyllosphaerae]
MEPFRIEIDQADLDDLADRLARTRWAEPETVDDRSQGLPEAYLRDLVAYWADGYDWRRLEQRLNGLPQFRTDIDGLGIHVIHVRSSRADATPLLLTHGWPGSVCEFLDVIGPLTEPADTEPAFHLVIPSLPGFGFSDKPTRPGWNIERIADAWATLMARLGYERYAAQGGDWGAIITTALGERDADHLLGIHLNMPLAPPDPDDTPTAQEAEIIAAQNEHRWYRTGYQKQQSTRPQTIGYSLVDSPVGQAAWIVEKFWDWTDHDGDLSAILTRDQILDGVMMYWLTASGASSARIYWEAAQAGTRPDVTVPVGVSMFPRELFRTSERWARKRYPTLAYFNELDRGGHFAALEQPELFVGEIRAWASQCLSSS